MARITVAGYMLRHPVAGNVLAFFHYVLGFHLLGHDVAYVEESGWPYSSYDPGTGHWEAFPTTGIEVARALGRRHCPGVPIVYVDTDSGQVDGVEWADLKAMLEATDLLVDIGGVCWLPEFNACRRRVLVDMDPFFSQVQGFASEVLDRYDMHFSYGANLGTAGCTVPTRGMDWLPAVPPVVTSLWPTSTPTRGAPFTTIANWSAYGALGYRGEHYGQKDEEFVRLVDLPTRTTVPLELGLSGAGAETLSFFAGAGWGVFDAGELSRDVDAYRGYITSSGGELSAAKHAYVKARTGWFSDRSVCYLASGKPVVLQDTGFSDWLPTGRGLMAFSTVEEAADRILRVQARYEEHCQAAAELASSTFASDVALRRLLDVATGAAQAGKGLP